MKIHPEKSHCQQAGVGRLLGSADAHFRAGAFTLVEVMVVLVLMTILLVAGFRAILMMNLSSSRLSAYTAAMAVVEAKIQDIRGASYKVPNANFKSSVTYITNSDSISLDQAGATFQVSGTVVSELRPFGSSHLVTVTGTFNTSGKPIVVSLQTVVNRFSSKGQ